MSATYQKHGRCERARRVHDRKTGRYRWQHCDECKGCRSERYDQILGSALAETETSAAVVSFTLTYRDVINEEGQKVPPDGAIRTNKTHLKTFKDRLRKDFSVRYLSLSEYGGDNGRAHFHVLAFFQWNSSDLKQLVEDIAYQSVISKKNRDEQARFLRRQYRAKAWKERLPKHHIGWLENQEFQDLLNNKEVLHLSLPIDRAHKREIRQTWKYWPHGIINAELVYCPDEGIFGGEKGAVHGAVRYVCHYIVSDQWRDSKKYKHLDFHQLPPWVQQSTRYGSRERIDEHHEWTFKWGNPLVKQMEEDLAAKYGRADPPLLEQIMRPKLNRTNQPPLGSYYFAAKGRNDALYGGDRAQRTYTLTGVFGRSSRKEEERKAQSGDPRPRESDRLKTFYMTKAQFHIYGYGYNSELLRMGKEETTGQDHVFDTLESQRQDARDAASGAFGFHHWRKSDKTRRKELEITWSNMEPESLKGLVPKTMIDWFVEHSKLGNWPERRKQRNQERREGKVIDFVQIDAFSKVIRTTQGRFFYEKNINIMTHWWRRELVTVEDMLNAVDGSLLPENARAMRIAREGKLDQTPLSKWRPDKVRDRLKRLVEKRLADKISKGEPPF